MSWLPQREKLDPKQASAIDFAVARDGNFYVPGEVDSYDSQTCTALPDGGQTDEHHLR